jgi:hypothetical protein
MFLFEGIVSYFSGSGIWPPVFFRREKTAPPKSEEEKRCYDRSGKEMT